MEDNTITISCGSGETAVRQLKRLLSDVDPTEAESIEITIDYGSPEPEEVEPVVHTSDTPRQPATNSPDDADEADVWRVIGNPTQGVGGEDTNKADALRAVAAAEGPVDYHDIIECLDDVAQGYASTLLGDLFRTGCIARRDLQRPYQYKLTPEGREQLKEWGHDLSDLDLAVAEDAEVDHDAD